MQAVLDRSRAVADAQAPGEQDPSRDRELAAAETDVAEGNPGDRQLQDDHLAADGAAGLEPQALTSMTERGQLRGRTPSPIRGAHRQGRCARMSPMNGRYGSALDRHTPRPTLPCSCFTTARNGCGAR